MQECNAKKNPNEKHFGHKTLKELAQGPCQTDSLRLSLLHPHFHRCKLGIGVSRWIRLKLNSCIGIKVKNFYEFMNKCHRILCFWHRHFLFDCLLWSLQLKTIWACMPNSTTKMTKPLRFVLFLASKMIEILGFWLI